jgi:uncharacterized protein (TIGR02145 family)
MKTTELSNLGKRNCESPLRFFLSLTLVFFFCAGLQAQVTIGGVTDPAPGALLDLNSSGGGRGGLLLSNVSIADLSKIPTGTNRFPGITAADNDDTNTDFTGAMVYHTGTLDIPAGIYIWNGVRWVLPRGCDCPAGTVADDECNCYPYASFGTAGVWMTQNLRTTEKHYDGINENLTPNMTGSTTNPYYTYPRLNTATGADIDTAFNAHKDYGLLYNWMAASGRTNADSDERNVVHDRHQGICPTGWHLPSDLEWIQLEEVIAASAANVYSTEGTVSTGTLTDTELRGEHGHKMTSTINVNDQDSKGTSNSREDNGFDALLVGLVNGNSGTAGNYGTDTYFWSSSSRNSSNSMFRNWYINTWAVLRNDATKYHFFSVRCKKND